MSSDPSPRGTGFQPVNSPSTEAPAGAGADPVISVRNVGKCYHIYDKPRDRLKQAALGRFRTYYRPFWALHDVSLDVMPGESVGIVGRNGSGKSTLLQMIAGTLTPTRGEIRVRGRVAALLELGSGFNPEFTGRENVFLQGSILGIPRREMERRFDSIASFADIGDFLDQPVKHYSSGMYARLAFSVAVSVDPEVLIVDEILAVGDMGFQQRCVTRMRQLLDRGCTLLLVSHAPDNIKSLCQKGLYLDSGRQIFFGSSEEAVDRYTNAVRDAANAEAREHAGLAPEPVAAQTDPGGTFRYGTGHAQVVRVRLLDSRGRPAEMFNFGEEVTVEIDTLAAVPLAGLDVHFHVRDPLGVDLFGTGTTDEGSRLPDLPAGGKATVRFRFANHLRAGSYGVGVTLTKLPEVPGGAGVTLDHVTGAATFGVIGTVHRPVLYKFHQPVAVEVAVAEQAAPPPEPALDPAAAAR